ncbi:DUF6098 family protein [Gryllotalpicola koreensis]|uniref:Uncharacterized protein n=1 Tax=Gryllotalpicola koreensis TaxID=993086 RepID=A0ABP7ZUC7_9MICO
MRELNTIDELAELIDATGEPVYVRYSKGPEADASESSIDHESGLELPGLSVNPLNPEEWWTRPMRDWLARQLCQYAHLREEDPDSRAWVLTGRVVGRGPDCEPLVAGQQPLALIADAMVDEAGRVYSARFDRE